MVKDIKESASFPKEEIVFLTIACLWWWWGRGEVPVKQGVCVEGDKFISNGHLVTGKEMVGQLEMQKES